MTAIILRPPGPRSQSGRVTLRGPLFEQNLLLLRVRLGRRRPRAAADQFLIRLCRLCNVVTDDSDEPNLHDVHIYALYATYM